MNFNDTNYNVEPQEFSRDRAIQIEIRYLQSKKYTKFQIIQELERQGYGLGESTSNLAALKRVKIKSLDKLGDYGDWREFGKRLGTKTNRSTNTD